MTNVNPNEPLYPYGGGTDNPGDNTALAGGPDILQATETGDPVTQVIHPPVVAGLAVGGTDTVLPDGTQAVPLTADQFESVDDEGADTGGVTTEAGDVRVSGQDETAGATETTRGVTPEQFPGEAP